MAIQFKVLKDLEYKTIQHIRTDTSFARLHTLVNAARQVPTSAPNAELNLHLSFTLPTRLREDHGTTAVDRRFHIGCLAKRAWDGAIERLTCSVMIGTGTLLENKVARKFHFDFEPITNRNLSELKPTYHFQLCGELSEHHKSEGYVDDDIGHLLPRWSQPRIAAPPMSLTLLLNWLLIEFGSDPTIVNARKSSHWQALVRQAEATILKPYFQAAHEFFESHTNANKSFFSSHLYEDD